MDAVEVGPGEPPDPPPPLRVRQPQAEFRACGGTPSTDADRPLTAGWDQARMLLELLGGDEN